MVSESESNTFILGTALLGLPAATLVLSAFGLWLGLPVSGLSSGAAALLMVGCIWAQTGRADLRRGGSLIAAFAAIVAVSVLMSGRIYDLSWDGQAYHQEAIIQLMRGWNPFHQTSLPFKVAGDGYNRWIDHYAKGPWICAASLAKLLGGIEYGKAFAPILLVSSGLLAFSVLRGQFAHRWQATLFSGLMALCPVVFTQLTSFYVDGLLASMLLCGLALMYHVHRHVGPRTLLPLAGSFILLVNVKSTGAVHACILAATMAIWTVLSPRPRRAILATISSSVALGLAVVGYQPYVVNTLQHGHPFYPLMGQGKVDIITTQINPSFAAMNQFSKALYSLFARTENDLRSYPVLKSPFSLSSSEIHTLAAVDTRIGGFGPWFGPVVILSLVLLVWYMFKSRRTPLAVGQRTLLGGITAVVVTGFAHPEAWWARYSPQLWLVAPLALAVVLAGSTSRWQKGAAWVLTTLLSVNLGMTVWSVTTSNIPANRLLHEQLQNLAAYTRTHEPVVPVFHYFPANRVRLTEAGVRWRDSSESQPVNATQLVRSDTVIIMY